MRIQPQLSIERRDPTSSGEVQARLAAEPPSTPPHPGRSGRWLVTLLRQRHGAAAWRCAHRNAQLVEGVISVIDYLVIERGLPRSVCGLPRARMTTGPQPAVTPARKAHAAASAPGPSLSPTIAPMTAAQASDRPPAVSLTTRCGRGDPH